jgi:hypothetical protein
VVFSPQQGDCSTPRGRAPSARWKAALIAVWLAAPLDATLLASIAQPAFEARYVLAAAPAMALAIGAGIVSLPRRWAIALAVVVALSVAIRLGQHYWSPGEAFSDKLGPRAALRPH